MSDDELQGLAIEAYELTDLARQALETEISQRRLDIVLAQDAAPPSNGDGTLGELDSADLDLVVLNRVWDLAEARHLKRALNNAGIPAYFGAENIENAEALSAEVFEKGIELKVRDRDEQRAMGVLANTGRIEPGSSDPVEEVEYIARCPRCHSREVVFQSLDTPSSAKSELESRYNWSCDSCGLKWQDDGVEEEN